MTPRVLFAIGLVALGVGNASLVQDLGCNQTSHYALVQSLAEGTSSIDAHHEQTCDKSYINGHFYSSKPPGLAGLSLFPYMLLDGLGLIPSDDKIAIWLLALLGATLPAIILVGLVWLVAVRSVEESVATVAALTFGMATLLLPFSSLYFAHALSALLGFGAFALVALTTQRRRLLFVALAGLVAGLAVVVEYPVALVALGVGVYASVGVGWRARAAAYVGGLAVGVLPLLAFNRLSFGSVWTLSYENAVINQGDTGHDVVGANESGIFGVTSPSFHAAVDLLLAPKGLLASSPVLIPAVLGLFFLYRRGLRAEALVAGGLGLAFWLYNAAYQLPFGGDVPGPRFLVPALPFLALGLADAYRRLPVITLALAAVSAGTVVVATITQPMLDGQGVDRWTELALSGDFTDSVLTLARLGNGPVAIAPTIIAFAASSAVAVISWYRMSGVASREGPQVVVALFAVFAWATVTIASRSLLDSSLERALLVALAAAAVGSVVLLQRRLSSWPVP